MDGGGEIVLRLAGGDSLAHIGAKLRCAEGERTDERQQHGRTDQPRSAALIGGSCLRGFIRFLTGSDVVHSRLSLNTP